MRTRSVRILLATAMVVWLAACGDDDTARDDPGDDVTTTTVAGPDPTDDPPDGEATEPTDPTGDLDFDAVEIVAEGLGVPWELAFVDDSTILATERDGQVRAIEDGELRDDPVAEVTVSANGESGLLGIALHPDFDEERVAYLYYTTDDGNQVSRFTVDDDLTFGDEQVLIDDIPAAPAHDGGRIAFGPDGHLYIATGDALEPELAADEDSLAGKILRLDVDGEVPDDNPTDGSPVWSSGHRNPQGLTWDAAGNLYAAEHGPSGELGLCCNDELNLVEAGGFYGWPFTMGEVDGVDGEPPAEPIAPVANSGDDTWAPSGVAARVEGGTTALYLANLASEDLLRFEVGDDPADVGDGEVVLDDYGRLRAALIGPDDCLYLTTSNTDGRGDPADTDDRILRVCPAAAEDLG